MQVINFETNNRNNTNSEVTLCLGFFDSLHIGHKSLISVAKTLSLPVCVFTFDDDISQFIERKSKFVYSFKQRLKMLEKLGVSAVVFSHFDEKLKNMSGEEFLNEIFSLLNVKYVVSGEDFKFGKGAKSGVDFLNDYLLANNKNLVIASEVDYNGEKASTTKVKELIRLGDTLMLKEILGDYYSVFGVVEKGFNIGSKIGFPTANLTVCERAERLKEGVYFGIATLYEKKYRAIINVGNRPTFDENVYKMEAHILGEFGELYNQELEINFVAKIRDIIKFENREMLANQLELDKKFALNYPLKEVVCELL